MQRKLCLSEAQALLIVFLNLKLDHYKLIKNFKLKIENLL